MDTIGNLKSAGKMVALALTVFLFTFQDAGSPARGQAAERGRPAESLSVRMIGSIPHDPRNFTQGLLYHGGKLYESTGLVGQSTLQRMDASTGRVENTIPVPGVFAEGLALWENFLVQLTWKSGMAFIYRLSDFSRAGTFRYETEGWGLASDGRSLIMSDGTDTIYFRDPFSFAVERKIAARLEGLPVERINELEFADGKIYANVWMENHIVRIDPSDGIVDAVIDASSLLGRLPPMRQGSVLNGIAYNSDSGTFYLTGKNWPLIFEVVFRPESGGR